MRGGAALAAAMLLAGAGAASAADSLTLTFGSYQSSPVLLTHFSIESPMAPTPEMVVISAAERQMPRTNGASAAISPPKDMGGDGKWKIAAQWIELQTSRAYRSELTIPVSGLTEAYGAYELNVIFGPNGLFLIGSDRISNRHEDRVDLAAGCGERVPSADRNWGEQTGRYPELPAVRNYMQPVPAKTHCPPPAR